MSVLENNVHLSHSGLWHCPHSPRKSAFHCECCTGGEPGHLRLLLQAPCLQIHRYLALPCSAVPGMWMLKYISVRLCFMVPVRLEGMGVITSLYSGILQA